MSSDFEKVMLARRDSIVEKVHAAFILDTSLTRFGKLSDSEKSWIMSAYPGSEIKTGSDQGADYYTVTPKFK
jgi:hypothetical protein